MFKGSMVAIVTPFKNNGFDEDSFSKLIEFHIEKGTYAIVPCGTTGESATLSFEEHERIIEFCVEKVNKRVPVIAGTGSNCTNEAVKLTKYAAKAGADGALLITPYYNKPTQEGLYQHYKKIAEEVDIPLILYNVPSRTGLNMLPQTVARLSEIQNIVGIKEASGSIEQAGDIIRMCKDDFCVLSGDDSIFFPILAIGGKGVISVTANIVPDRIANIYDSFISGDIDKARAIHYQLQPLHKAVFIETNPIPIKTALYLMGKVPLEFRLPLLTLSKENFLHLKKVLKEYSLI
ncbi:MAG: 4-hydroxy-tetrahydrodipicolinate synthase [Thermodesulfobacteriota bacterium]|nr:4-hydroxy-tetrahydrodipicolinate synthase [Thermodesulfobacteriota bacterium]